MATAPPSTTDTSVNPPKPPKAPNRLQSHFVAFLGGLTVAGFYAGYRFKEDLGGFAGAINKLQHSVDDVGDNLKKIKDLERSLKELQAENDATKKKLSDLTTRVDSLQ